MIKYTAAAGQSDIDAPRLATWLKWTAVNVALLGSLIASDTATAGKADDTEASVLSHPNFAGRK